MRALRSFPKHAGLSHVRPNGAFAGLRGLASPVFGLLVHHSGDAGVANSIEARALECKFVYRQPNCFNRLSMYRVQWCEAVAAADAADAAEAGAADSFSTLALFFHTLALSRVRPGGGFRLFAPEEGVFWRFMATSP